MNYDFKKNIEKGTLHHAFIIEGGYITDKAEYAKGLAKAILCEELRGIGCGECKTCRKIDALDHLDVFFLEPEAKKGSKVYSIKDEQILSLQERLARKPFEAERNIAIICGADTMTLRAYNRLLKTLEEPPLGTVIFLLCENADKMPETVRSRCIQLRLLDASVKKAGNDEEKNRELIVKSEKLLSMIFDGEYFYKIKRHIEENVKDKKSAYQLLDMMEQICIDMILARREKGKGYTVSNLSRAIHECERARREIEKNANVLYTMKKMTILIGGQ